MLRVLIPEEFALGVLVPEVFAGVGLFYKTVGIDKDNISREMALSQLDIISVPLQIFVVEFGISCLDIVVFLVQLY